MLAWKGKAFIVQHSFLFFLHFYPYCFHSLSYCSSNVARTQLPGFPLSEAKDGTPTACQDTLSATGSLQTGWGGEGEVGWWGGVRNSWEGKGYRKGWGKYKKGLSWSCIGEEMTTHDRSEIKQLFVLIVFYNTNSTHQTFHRFKFWAYFHFRHIWLQSITLYQPAYG